MAEETVSIDGSEKSPRLSDEKMENNDDVIEKLFGASDDEADETSNHERERSRSKSKSRSRSRSLSHSPQKNRSRSRSESRSLSRSRSRSISKDRSSSRRDSKSRSRSRSRSLSRSRSRSRSSNQSRSPSGSRSRSRDRSVSRSQSRSVSRSRSRGRSGSGSRSRSRSRDRSGSRSRSRSTNRSRSSSKSSNRSRSRSKSSSRSRSRSRSASSDKSSQQNKRKRVISDSDSEGEEGRSKKQATRSRSSSVEPQKETVQENLSDSDEEVRRNLSQGNEETEFQNDFDQMMAKKKELNAGRRRRKMNVDIINDNEEYIAYLVREMRSAADEDRKLHSKKKPAIQKIKMLSLVMSQLKKCDLLEGFLDANVLSALTDWLAPMPDKSLPSLSIRENILKWLSSLPPLNSEMLKISGIGKAVMYLFKHPRELKENKRICGTLISAWARPIFDNSDDFKTLTRDERLDRDMELSKSSRKREREEQEDASKDDMPVKPGQPGWCYRARVPMPSSKDYVNRPKWTSEVDISKNTKKQPTRLQKQIRAFQEKKRQNQNKRAVKISIEGRNMAL